MGKFTSLKGKSEIALSDLRANVSDEEAKTVLTRTVGLGLTLRAGMTLVLKGEPILSVVDGKTVIDGEKIRKGAFWSLPCDILSEDGDVLAKNYDVPMSAFWRTGKRFASKATTISLDGEEVENTYGRQLFGDAIARHPFSSVLYEKENEYSKVCSFWEHTGVDSHLRIAEEMGVYTLPYRSLDFKSKLGREWGSKSEDWTQQWVLFFDLEPKNELKTRTKSSAKKK